MPQQRFLTRPAVLLVFLLPFVVTACQSAGGTPPPEKQPPVLPPGSLAAELVGVWQQSVASAGDYQDEESGAVFTMTSGYNAVLKLRGEGEYYFSLFAAGVAHDCASVSRWDQSVGAVTFSGSTLTLTPYERELTVGDCHGERTSSLPNDPLELVVALEEQLDFNGMRVQRMDLTYDSVPLTLTALHQHPTDTPFAPERPADFTADDNTTAGGLLGLWTANPGDPTDFFDPSTGEFALPGDGEFDYEQVRIEVDVYELSRTWTEYDVTGICQKDYVYFERGTPSFSQVFDIYEDGEYRIGHARFEATLAAVVVQIRECGEDDGAYLYDLVPVTSYYQWDLWKAGEDATLEPARLKLSCPWDWEQSEWQFMVCGGFDQDTEYFDWN